MTATAMVRKDLEYEWVDLAGHRDAALTKLLVTREVCGAQTMDFFLSSYAPKACAEEHVHTISEEIFYFISGEGIFVLDGQRHVVARGSVVFVPPNTKHAIFNTGFEHLVFAVCSSPPEPEFHEKYHGYFQMPTPEHD